MKLRILTAEDVRRCLPMDLAIEAMADAYRSLSAGEAQIPQRSAVALGDPDAIALFMPATVRNRNQSAVKIVSVVPGNRARGLPTIHALVLALDPSTGQPLALLEGATLTAIRTGAGSGAATAALAREDVRTAAIIGTGVQAETQLQAICSVRSIARVLVYSPTPAHRRGFVARVRDQPPVPGDVQEVESADEAVQQADIICTATTSTSPVFDGNLLQDGAHINAVGSFQPHMEELDLTTIRRSLVVVDSLAAAMEEAGELIGPIRRGEYQRDSIHAELGSILSGQTPGRTSPDQITLFKSVGVAVQDAAAASLAIARADQLDLGQLIDL